jgi:hypothetical protein
VKKKILNILFALVLALSFSLVTIVPIVHADPAPPTCQGYSDNRSGSTSGAINVTSIAVSKPASTASGDLLIGVVITDGSAGTFPVPSGWTLINSGTSGTAVTLGTWYKKAGGSEPATYTWSWTSSQTVFAFIIRITGQDPTTPIDVSAPATGSSTTPTCPTVTTSVADTLVLRIFGFDSCYGYNASYPAGHTGIVVESSRPGCIPGAMEHCSGGAAYKTQATAGATGPASFTASDSWPWRALTVAIRPISCTTYYRDNDNDGYGQTGDSLCLSAPSDPYDATVGGDCNDSNAAIHPGATEVCNSVDDNCNGQIDEGQIGPTWYRDSDGDGYGDLANSTQACSQPAGYVANHDDCNDSDPYIHPGALEVCDGKDNNCNNLTDAADTANFIPLKVQLGIILDGSSSVTDADFTAEKNGLVDALNDPNCLPHDGTVELTVVQMGSQGSLGSTLEIGPVVITDSNYSDIADDVSAIDKATEGGASYTPMACAIYLLAQTMHDSHCFSPSLKQVLNIITDGVPNQCCPASGSSDNNSRWDCGGAGCNVINGCQAAMDSAKAARDYAINLLGMTTYQDEFDVEGFVSPGVPQFVDPSAILTWFQGSMVYRQPGHVYSGTGSWPAPGWVYLVTSNIRQDFKNAICHKACTVIANAGSDQIICAGSSVGIGDSPTGQGGIGTLTYSWNPTTGLNNPSLANPTATPSSTTEYMVTVTDAHSCYATDNVTVTVNPKPAATASNNGPVCEGNTLTLTGGPSTGVTYSWTGPNSYSSPAQSPTVSTNTTSAMAGDYTLTVTNGSGCTDNATTTVIVNTKPAATASNNGPVCEGTTLTLTGGPSTGVTYSWTGPNSYSSPAQSPTVSTNATSAMAGDYTLTVTNGSGCTDNKTTTVIVNTKPAATASNNGPVCEGKTLTLTGGPSTGVTYSWTGPNSFSNSTQSPTVSTNTTSAMAGDYTLTVTNGSGCTDNKTTTVIVNTKPAATASNNGPVCEGNTLTLTGGPVGMSTYSWTGPNSYSSPAQSPTVSTNATSAMAGIYTLTVTNGTGCTDNKTTTVIVNAKPAATASNNGPVCEGNTLTLTGGPVGMSTYSWTGPNSYSSPAQSPTVSTNTTPAMAGIYTLTVTNGSGCTDNKTTTVIVNTKPTATASSNSPVCLGNTIQLNGGPDGMASYSWTGPNGFSSNQQSPSIANATAAMSGNYVLTVISTSGCTGNAAVTVSVVQCGGGGVSTIIGEVGFGQTAPPVTGGTCPMTLTVNMLGQITKSKMTSDGVLCEDCLAFDPPRQNSWEAKAGTKLTLEGNKVPKLIKVTLAGSSPPSGPTETIGQTYEINAYPSLSGTDPLAISISPLFSMSSAYDPNQLPKNTSEVIFAYYPNPNQGWLAMGSEGVVAQIGEARGTLNSFVPDTLLAKLAETAAKFKASDLSIRPSKASPNQQITISANVANTGISSGDYTIELKVDGTVTQSKQVTLAAGASQIVSFTITGGAVGRYQVEIAGLTGEFVVAGPTVLNWWLIWGIIAAVILAVGIWILVRWRRFS